ncbi:MAG: hypothetical protein Fur0044_20700 [Anaerolineae bacterium]|nr:hypothetical protein [Anaerolineales bacterium]MCQ3975065.1 hypothetical protein [Anaerolineae bacterium]
MAQTITGAKQIQRKSRSHIVRQVRSNWYKVTSGETGRTYDVNLGLNGGTCTCKWGRERPDQDRRSACSHVIAAMNFRAAQKGRRVSAWARPEDAERQHRPTLPIGDGVILTSRVKWKVNGFKTRPKPGGQQRKSRAH